MLNPDRFEGHIQLLIFADLDAVPASGGPRWTALGGPYDRAAVRVRARSVFATTRATRDVYDDFCAHVRAALRLPDRVAFHQCWSAYQPHRGRGGPTRYVHCTFLRGAHARVAIAPRAHSITAHTFEGLAHVAAAIMRRRPFAPAGARFFGFDRDTLIDLAPHAVRDTEFRCKDGWPAVFDNA